MLERLAPAVDEQRGPASLCGLSRCAPRQRCSIGGAGMNISILKGPPRTVVEKPFDRPRSDDAEAAAEIAAQIKERLWQRMARECEAMVQHALSTGRAVSVETIERLNQAIFASVGPDDVAARDRPDDASPEDTPPRVASEVATSRFGLLASAHAELALAIAPATPEGVCLIADEYEKHPIRSQFGPLPLVRQMLALAMLSLIVLLVVGLAEEVNTVNFTKTMLELSGYELLVVEAFLVAAASLGATFANLQKINAVISEGTYDPRVQSTYWTRLVMGVISGIVMSEIVYDFLRRRSGTDIGHIAGVGQSLLALLGGYSVDIVNGLIRRAIAAIATFFGLQTGSETSSRTP